MPLPEEVVQSFPEEIRQDASWQKFDDVGGIAKSYVEIQKMAGRSIAIPDEKAAPEDLEKWKSEHLPKLASRGIIDLPPSKVEDYKLPTIEGYAQDKAVTDSFIKDVALANKMTPKQVEAVMKFDAQRTAAYKNMFLTSDAAEGEFKQLMGADYETVNSRVTSAMKALSEDHPAIGKLAERLRVFEVDENGKPTGKIYPFNSHPLGKSLYEVLAGLTQEDHSDGGAPMGEDSVDAIRAKIDAIRADEKMPGYRKADALEPLYKALVEAEKREGRAA